MKQSIVTVPWKEGMNLLAATKVARLAMSFRSRISFRCNEKIADARNILAILILCAAMGATLRIEVNGEDEALASEALSDAFSASQDKK